MANQWRPAMPPLLLGLCLCTIFFGNVSALQETINIRSFSHNETHPKLVLNSLQLPAVLIKNLQLTFPGELERKMLSGRYTFRNQQLLMKALLHGAYEPKKRGNLKDTYEPLDQIGQMVLDYMVTRVIIMNSLKLDGHSLSTMRNVLLSKNTIAFIAIKNGLDDHLFLDPKDRNGTSSLAKFKAAVSDVNNYQALLRKFPDRKQLPRVGDFVSHMMKAVIGAVYVDSGFSMQTADDVFMPMFKSEIEVVYNKVANCLPVTYSSDSVTLPRC